MPGLRPGTTPEVRHLHDVLAQVLAVISIVGACCCPTGESRHGNHGVREELHHDAVPVLPGLPGRATEDRRRDPARRRAARPHGRERVTAVAARHPAHHPAPGPGPAAGLLPPARRDAVRRFSGERRPSGRWAAPPAQRPVHTGGRLSRNAAGPSCASALWYTGAQIRSASSNRSGLDRYAVRLAASTDSGAFAAIRIAICCVRSRSSASGTTSLTSPTSYARRAVSGSP